MKAKSIAIAVAQCAAVRGMHRLGGDSDRERNLMITAQGIPVGKTGKLWKLVPAGGN